MAEDYAHNGYARANRERKAVALETACAQHGKTADDVRRFDDRDKRWIEKVAGVNRASDETWALAMSLLADAEASPARAMSKAGTGERW